MPVGFGGRLRGKGPEHRDLAAQPTQFVVSDRGELVARYDKRFLSHTEVSYLYTPGREPLVFEVGGIRIGCALCVEANFPPLFAEYERLGVDCVLLSVMVDDAPRARVAQAYGTLYSYWLGYAVPAQFSATVPSGIVAPGGRWLAQCPADGQPALATWPFGTPGPGAAGRRKGSTRTDW
ncbi:carbon-nitrogen hydrolase family protein [Streptomyces sp. NPDC056883]|uniref:carbon-nitrogen hydrolase family protein n=1 Tax=Streptomyces sp. NPDC056883 TaxID=3345959 RepID=UPI0036BA60F1